MTKSPRLWRDNTTPPAIPMFRRVPMHGGHWNRHKKRRIPSSLRTAGRRARSVDRILVRNAYALEIDRDQIDKLNAIFDASISKGSI
jgi:hypothetical protein